jgi:large subunit ribosomal protein L15
MRLNEIRDKQGAHKSRTRVGRGEGSGKGKTGGRGQKGQKSRSGVALVGFEGGQMPIFRRTPKRGFNNIFRKNYEIVNLGRLQKAIDEKKLSAGAVNADALQQAGLIRNNKDGVRLLGQGDLSAKIEIEVAGATKSAIAAVEGAGGKVILPEPTKVELEAREKSAKSQAKKDAAAPKKAAADDEADAPAAE